MSSVERGSVFMLWILQNQNKLFLLLLLKQFKKHIIINIDTKSVLSVSETERFHSSPVLVTRYLWSSVKNFHSRNHIQSPIYTYAHMVENSVANYYLHMILTKKLKNHLSAAPVAKHESEKQLTP
jgi:hypothetical protein